MGGGGGGGGKGNPSKVISIYLDVFVQILIPQYSLRGDLFSVSESRLLQITYDQGVRGRITNSFFQHQHGLNFKLKLKFWSEE